MSINAIEISHAKKIFGHCAVLDNITVQFAKGQIHGIIGRNGSGKTMLLKSICGFVPLTSGTIIVNNQIIGKDVDIPPHLGIIIEAPGFLPKYSGYRNLKMLSSIQKNNPSGH